MYATPEDIRARYREVYPLLAGKDAEGRPDTAAVEQALAEAASEIDAILGRSAGSFGQAGRGRGQSGAGL